MYPLAGALSILSHAPPFYSPLGLSTEAGVAGMGGAAR